MAGEAVATKIIRIDVQTSTASTEALRGLEADMKRVEKSSATAAISLQGIGQGLKSFAALSGLSAGAVALTAIGNAAIVAADQMLVLEKRLAVVFGGDATRARTARDDIARIAVSTGKELDSVAKLYEKAARAGERFGISQRQVSEITEGFSNSLRLSGASTQEASAAIIQFGQALASGRLQGDEFRSLMENNAYFMTELAKSVGVTTSQLKKMGTEGALSSAFLFDALTKTGADGLTLLERINAEAAKLPKTFSEGWASIKSASAAALGDLAGLFADSVLGAGSLQEIADGILELGKSFANTRAELNALDASPLERVWSLLVSIDKLTAGGNAGSAGSSLAGMIFGEGENDVARSARLIEETTKKIADLQKRVQGKPSIYDSAFGQSSQFAKLPAELARQEKILESLKTLQAEQIGGDERRNIENNTAEAAGEEVRKRLAAEGDLEASLKKRTQAAKDAASVDEAALKVLRELQRENVLLADAVSGGLEKKREQTALEKADFDIKQKNLKASPSILASIREEAAAQDSYNAILKGRLATENAMKAAAETAVTGAAESPFVQAEAMLVKLRQEEERTVAVTNELFQLLFATEDSAEQDRIKKVIDQINGVTDATKAAAKAGEETSIAFQDVFGRALADSIDNVANKLVDFATGVTSSFSGMVKDVVRELGVLYLKMQLIAVMKKALAAAGGAGGFVGTIAGFLGFAKGGVMTEQGSLPLQKYAGGGIADRPQVAVFGEGFKREAYVPLPDGRTIPVTVKDQGGGQSVVVNQTVNVGQGVSRNEVYNAVQTANAQLLGMLNKSRNREGMFAS